MTDRRVPSLDEAKAQFKRNGERAREIGPVPPPPAAT